MTRLDDRAQAIFVILANHSEGQTLWEIGRQLRESGHPRGFNTEDHGDQVMVHNGIDRLREQLRDPDHPLFGVSVPVVQMGYGDQRYMLSTSREQAEPWQSVRAKTMLSRNAVDQGHWNAMLANNPEDEIAQRRVKAHSRVRTGVRSLMQNGDAAA